MIYLHIGYPKTGTTSIQKGLFDNRDYLKELGYLYPSSGIYIYGHHNIYYDLARNEKAAASMLHHFNANAGTLDDLIVEIKKWKHESPDGHIILSSEAFFTLAETQYKRLISQLERVDEITAIMVVRRQDQWLKSFWAMEIGRMNTGMTFEEWIKERDLPKRANINVTTQKLKRWAPSVKLRIEGFKNFISDGVFDSFLKACDIEQLDSTKVIYPERSNESLELVALDMMRSLSKRYMGRLKPKLKNDTFNYLRRISTKYEWAKTYDPKARNINASTIDYLEKKYSPSNELLIKRMPNLQTSLSFDADDGKQPGIVLKDRIPRLQQYRIFAWMKYQVWKSKLGN